MDTESLKQQFQKRDRVIRIFSHDGYFRAVAVKNTNMAKTAQIQHKLSHIPAFFLARTMAASTMMAAFLKGEERIIVECEGSSFIKKIFSESLHTGETKGFISAGEEIELSSVSDALGLGSMRVTRVLYNKSEPVQGIVDLIKGDIATDLAYYYTQSEQTPSAVIIDTLFDDKGIITSSTGIIVQAMPGAKPSDIKEVTMRLAEIQSLSTIIDRNSGLESALREFLPFEFSVVKNHPVDFYCRCSKKSFMQRLITFGEDEIKDMQLQGNNELVCQYCNEHYYLDDNDYENMITEITAKKN